jgi:hypothetical protein
VQSSAADEEQRALATKKKRLQLAELLGYDKPDQGNIVYLCFQ